MDSAAGRAAGALEEALDVVSDVFVLLDRDFRVVHHNAANRDAMRAAGADPDEAIGRVVWDVLRMPTGTIAESECRRAMRDRVATQWEERYHPDLCLRGRAFPTSDGGLVVVAQNVTEQWKAVEAARAAVVRALRLQAVTSALSQAATPREVVRVVIAQGCEALGAAGGFAATPDGDALEVVDAIGYGDDILGRYRRFPCSAPYPACEVARTGEPVWTESRAERITRYPALHGADSTRWFESWLYVPLVVATRVEGVLTFAFREPHALAPEDRAFALALAQQCALALERARLLDVERRLRADAESAARWTARLHALATRLAATTSPSDVALAVLEEAREAFAVDRGTMSLLGDDGDTMTSLAALGYDDDQLEPWRSYSIRASIAPTSDVVASGVPCFIESVDAARAWRPAFADVMARNGVAALAVLPVAVQSGVRGVIGLAWTTPHAPSAEEGAFMRTFAAQSAQALERALGFASERRARAAAERAASRIRFLAEASMRLAETSLSLDDTLGTIARLAVPEVADWAFVSMCQPDGTILPLAIHHRDPAKVALGWEMMRRYPLAAAVRAGTGAVIRTGVPELRSEIPAGFLELIARDAEHLRMLREAGFRSHLIVPLRVGTDVVGALFLADSESDRRFGADDVALAEEVARRAGAAIENARLHEAERGARASAEEANRAKLDFLRAMSHELRTPLNAIGGYAELLELGVQGPTTEAQRTALGRIVSNQRHLLGIITDILNFARLDAGRLSYALVDVSVRELLDGTEPLIAPQLREKHIAFDVAACAGELRVLADAERVRQVLLNLLANAVKFTAAGGRVAIECDDGATMVAMRVRDTGIGIAADRLDDIFEPFVQVHRSLAAPTTGTGLGLAISRELARGMGGDLTAASEPGVGSVFTLSLPRA